MSRMKVNVPRVALIALSAILAAGVATAADTQKSSDVTVQAERPTSKVVGRDATGAPVVFVEVRHRVTYSDLDLAIPSNAEVLKARVHDAARGACRDLDTLYPISSSSNQGCASKAEKQAMPQVLSAIAAAQARKSAAD